MRSVWVYLILAAIQVPFFPHFMNGMAFGFACGMAYMRWLEEVYG